MFFVEPVSQGIETLNIRNPYTKRIFVGWGLIQVSHTKKTVNPSGLQKRHQWQS